MASAAEARAGMTPEVTSAAEPVSHLAKPDQQEPAETTVAADLPVAIAALDVAGQVRERSPADMAIFGDGATRLIDRFVQPSVGQSLLARAASDGSGEATAWLNTPAGQQRFRISLWRQRGGERIRIVAVFAPCEVRVTAASDDMNPGMTQPIRAALTRMGSDMRSPVAAALGFAEMIRANPEAGDSTAAAGHAADIIAAAWRLMRIADDLEAVGNSGEARSELNLAEVDIARLARRVSRLAIPVAQAADVTIGTRDLPKPGLGPLVLGDENMLWSIIDNLLQNAIRHAGRGAAVTVALRARANGLDLEIADNGPGMEAEDLARQLLNGIPGRGLALISELARTNGANLAVETAPGQGLTVRIVFPAARCLNPA